MWFLLNLKSHAAYVCILQKILQCLCSFSSACHALGVAQLDSVIIAPPPVEDGTSLSVEYLQPYWQELENLVQNKKIVAIGTSDLDKTLLEQLYLWAQVRTNFLLVVFLGQSNCFVGCHTVIYGFIYKILISPVIFSILWMVATLFKVGEAQSVTHFFSMLMYRPAKAGNHRSVQ